MRPIEKVAVIGSGVMGSGIAAHIANTGIPVILLDIPDEKSDRKDIRAVNAINHLLETKPSPLMHSRSVQNITPGHVDDLECLKTCDWIIEVIVENFDLKQQLYHKIYAVCKSTAVITSNTSTFPLSRLIRNLPLDFQKRFFITHFFNPPRYMRLLEVISGNQTDSQLYQNLIDFIDVRLGKTVIRCHDRPGFIANRIGNFWMQTALSDAISQGIAVNQADVVLSKPLGIPKTGAFGLMDLIGLDVMRLMGRSLQSALTKDDFFQSIYREHDIVSTMIDQGYTGRKGKGGFYTFERQQAQTIHRCLNLQTGIHVAYEEMNAQLVPPHASSDLEMFFAHPDPLIQYACGVTLKMLWYSASLVPEITEDPLNIDTAMKLGYGWTYGPFEIYDKFSKSWLSNRFEELNLSMPALLKKSKGQTFYKTINQARNRLNFQGVYQPIAAVSGQTTLSDIKLRAPAIYQDESASLWDLQDGVVCFEFTTKMNVITADVLNALEHCLVLTQQNYKALVIYNEGIHFSVGADLKTFLSSATRSVWSEITDYLHLGQRVCKMLSQMPFPTVGAPFNKALGGGCELLLYCDAIQAHAELNCGLVESHVGLVPGWGGGPMMLQRAYEQSSNVQDLSMNLTNVFKVLITAQVSQSAALARDMLILRPTDGITAHRNRLLDDAKTVALKMLKTNVYLSQRQERAQHIHQAQFDSHEILTDALTQWQQDNDLSSHDMFIAQKLIDVLSISCRKTDQTYTEINAFLALIQKLATQARIQHVLTTGKSLKN